MRPFDQQLSPFKVQELFSSYVGDIVIRDALCSNATLFH